ncbi:sn-1-specific diacylglycerol lipase ABHD11-like isoform X2 [Notamacropus eugenii]|uniref:sn-1-specific diacylglycerol lipase ABHD11-like isoform X2 n=1 Tax=Notamacropus eugenii TaxID=9315 RepID=UPI003B680210
MSIRGNSSGPRPVPLSYRLLDGQDTLPPVVFLHGMFSNKNIFQAEAETLAQKTGRKVLTVDARNHGESPHNADCSYEAMSSDLLALLSQLRLTPCVLIGHSMGGRTAMAFALQKDASIRQYLFNSLVRVNGKYVWKVNAENLWQQQQQLLDPLAIQGVYHGPTLFLISINSSFVPPSHYHKIKLLFPEAQFQTIPDTGHVLHIKKPQDFMNSLLSFLS